MAFYNNTIKRVAGGGGVVETVSYESTEDSTEYMRSGQALLGIGATFSLALWVRRTTPNLIASAGLFFSDDGGGRQNQVSVLQLNNTTVEVEIRGPGADPSDNMRYDYQNLWTSAPGLEWEHYVIVYNNNGASQDTLLTYFNGVDITEKSASTGEGDPKIVKINDNTPEHVDSSRYVTIGSQAALKLWEGEMYNCGLWDVCLSPGAVTSMYNAGSGGAFDLNADSGSYVNSADLQHLWRFDDAADRGKDLGNAGTLLDLDDNAAGTQTFITSYPGQ